MKRLLCVILCSASVFAQSPVLHRSLQDKVAIERARGGGPASTAPAQLIDHGGPVLPSSKTFAIFWGQAGDFPVDYVMGMKSLFTGLVGSSYLGIALQYMPSTSIATTYPPTPYFDASAPPARAPRASD